ncbi:hypothetical protein ACOSP7_005032 [Xanthoceras sorbifolium]
MTGNNHRGYRFSIFESATGDVCEEQRSVEATTRNSVGVLLDITNGAGSSKNKCVISENNHLTNANAKDPTASIRVSGYQKTKGQTFLMKKPNPSKIMEDDLEDT